MPVQLALGADRSHERQLESVAEAVFRHDPLAKSSLAFPRDTFNESEIRTPQGGFAIGLSVDEAGKAEGYHERLPESPVMILADDPLPF